MLKSSLRIVTLLVFSSTVFMTCVNPPDYPDQPVIEYVGVNDNEIWQSSNGSLPADTLEIYFSFTDGDGDLSTSNDSLNIFITESRGILDGTPIYSIPTIPEEGTGNGIRGEITVRLTNNQDMCCVDNSGLLCPDNPPNLRDSFSYEIQIRDNAGNFSNKIRTETLFVRCRQQ